MRKRKQHELRVKEAHSFPGVRRWLSRGVNVVGKVTSEDLGKSMF